MSEETKPELLSTPDLAELIAQQKEMQLANLKAQVEELKYKNVILQIKNIYALADADTVDAVTGVIKRAPKAEAV